MKVLKNKFSIKHKINLKFRLRIKYKLNCIWKYLISALKKQKLSLSILNFFLTLNLQYKLLISPTKYGLKKDFDYTNYHLHPYYLHLYYQNIHCLLSNILVFTS